jgi:hypothetical protein
MVTNSSKMTDYGAFSSTIEFGKRNKNLNKSLERSRDTLAGYRDSDGSGDDLQFSIR